MTTNEITTTLNGKLGAYFNLALKPKITKVDDHNVVEVRLRLIKLNMPDVLLDKVVRTLNVKLKINDDVKLSNSVKLDLNQLIDNIILLKYKIELYNQEPIKYNVNAEIKIEDESGLLEDTSFNINIIIRPVEDRKLFVDLVGTEFPDKIICSVVTTIAPDFLEYKMNDLDWTKLNGTSFSIDRLDKNQFIQVRGKKNNYFSYSNVLKIINSK